MKSIEAWFLTELGCVPGQREFRQGRYVYGPVRNQAEASELLNEFITKTEQFRAAGCLLVFPDSIADLEPAAQLQHIGAIASSALNLPPPKIEGAGHSMTATLPLRCPATNRVVEFDDFDAIAFLPVAGELASACYDPNVAAPWP